MKNKNWQVNSLLLVFFLSGFSGLMYQSVWSHYLKLVLGHAAYAQTLVLIIFMGGLSLGAWLVSLFSEKIELPLLWYVVIELSIGIAGIFFHQEFLFFHYLTFDYLFDTGMHERTGSLIKWGGMSLAILPQSILLGTTFPLISAALIRINRGEPGYILGSLYFSNSMGAAIGVLVSGLFLIEHTGLPGTTMTAGLINVGVALFAWLVYRSSPESESGLKKGDGSGYADDPSVSVPLVILLTAFLTGVASFFYEVGWIRMLSLVLGSTVHAFEIMLCAFILGLALGSLYIRKRIDRIQSPIRYLAWIQIVMGMLALATLPLYTQSYTWTAFLIDILSNRDHAYFGYYFGSQLICLIIMFPAAFMAGMTLPLLTSILIQRGGGEAAIGKVYAANTLGAILGVTLAIHLIMPMLGVYSLIAAGSLIDILVGIVILVIYVRKNVTWIQKSLAMLCLVAVIFAFQSPTQGHLLSSGVYRTGNLEIAPRDSVRFYRDGKTSSVAVIRDDDGTLSLRTNGKGDASIAPLDRPYAPDEVTMVMLATLPLALKPDSTRIANIGMGSGLTTHVLLGSDRVESVDTIEIERGVIEASRLFSERSKRAHSDSRSKIHVDDAKSWFSGSRQKYDAIVSEPSNPWMNGIASLYSVEFYRYINKYLEDDGILVQWLHLYEFNSDLVATVVKSLGAVFSHYQIYNTNDADIIIVASSGNTLKGLDDAIFRYPALKSELDRVELRSLSDLKARYLGNESNVGPLVETISVPANSDYYPYLAYKAPRAFHLKQSAREIVQMHFSGIPVTDWLNRNRNSGFLTGKSTYFPAYRLQQRARAVTEGNTEIISEDLLREAVLTTESPLDPGFSQSAAVDAFIHIASVVNPSLPLVILDRYWQQKKSTFSDSRYSSITDWIELHHAISQFDSEKAGKLATTIISNHKDLSNDHKQYLVIALMAANVTGGNYSEAERVISKYNLYNMIDSLPFELRMLVGMTFQNRLDSAQADG